MSVYIYDASSSGGNMQKMDICDITTAMWDEIRVLFHLMKPKK